MTTLSARLGERLRLWREHHKLSQDEIAALARRWGLDWTRSVVAAIESGRRALSVEELLLLPWLAGHRGPEAMKRGQPAPMELADLLNGLDWVPLTRGVVAPDGTPIAPGFVADGVALRTIVQGRATKSDFSPWFMDVPASGHSMNESTLGTMAENQTVIRHLKLTDSDRPLLEAAHADKLAEAEQQAARRLRTFPLAVAVAARKRWGQALTTERDRRVAEQARQARPDTTPEEERQVETPEVEGQTEIGRDLWEQFEVAAKKRHRSPPKLLDQILRKKLRERARTLQALRGHVTRALLEELRPDVEGLKVRKQRGTRGGARRARE